jgi:hypothetical protein
MTPHLHCLCLRGPDGGAGAFAAALCLCSRGLLPLGGGEFQPIRDALADVLGDGPLAELLRSGRPLLANRRGYGFVFLGDAGEA